MYEAGGGEGVVGLVSKKRWVQCLSQGRHTQGTPPAKARASDERYQLCSPRPRSAQVNIVGPFGVTSAARWWGCPSDCQVTDELTGELFHHVARTHAWSPSSRRPQWEVLPDTVYGSID